MTTMFLSKSECLPPAGDPAEADRDRRAECMARVLERLSAIGAGICHPPGKTVSPAKEPIREMTPYPDSETTLHFLLLDRNGPIAEFKSWEDARRYLASFQCSGASIIRVRKKGGSTG